MKRLLDKKARLRYEEKGMLWIMRFSTLIIIMTLCMILITILNHGVGSLSWEMISKTPKGGYYFGKEGGILNAIMGSIYLAVGATLLAFVIGLPVTIFMNTCMRRHKRTLNVARFILDVLTGIPSIVYGAFGFIIMIALHVHASLMCGIIVVAIIVLPVMIRSMDEAINTVPQGLQESSLSLGITSVTYGYKVLCRQCLPAIVTAILLSFGRAIGDAASVLFTTGFTDNLPQTLSEPAATLPLAIFFQLSSPIPEVQERAYAAATILTIIILFSSIMTRVIGKSCTKNAIKE